MNNQVNSGLLSGRKVRVVRPISRMEQDLLGREFEIRRVDETHGYAVVGDEWGDWHVHPEALELLGCDRDCSAGCGAQWYGDHGDPCPACGAA